MRRMRHMMQRCLIVSLILSTALGLQTQPDQISTPISIWGSAVKLGNKAVAETIEAHEILSDLLSAAVKPSHTPSDHTTALIDLAPLSTTKPDIVLVYITKGTPSESFQQTVQKIAAVNTDFSVHLPNAVDTDGGRSHVFKALQPIMKDARVSVIGSCSPEVLQTTPVSAAYLREVLEADAATGKPRVAVVCAADSSNSKENTEEEKELLQSLLAVVTALTDKHLVVHTVTYPGVANSKRRMLLQSSNSSGNGTEQVCDEQCQRDVTILEGFIIFVLLGLALTVITFCMHGIDVPTRFPSVKDSRQHQD